MTNDSTDNKHSTAIYLARLIGGGLLVAAMFLPLYLFVLRDDKDSTIAPAVLRQTPAVEGSSHDVGLADGKLAPDFEISTPQGERLRLSSLRGRPVVINFWATWCGGCLTEMPELKALQRERGADVFTVLAVNAGETPAEAQRFIDFLDAPFVYGLDLDLVLADAYGVYGLPLSVFIDSRGVVRATHRGHADRPQLEKLTDAAIEARPPGELPFALRLISTVPRERVLEVTLAGAGRLTFSSRSLRCDPGYCAQPAVDSLAQVKGIQAAKTEAKAGQAPSLSVRYDANVLTPENVIDAVVAALNSLPDPVYTTALEVRYDPAP